jgi:hypothetical protein
MGSGREVLGFQSPCIERDTVSRKAFPAACLSIGDRDNTFIKD